MAAIRAPTSIQAKAITLLRVNLSHTFLATVVTDSPSMTAMMGMAIIRPMTAPKRSPPMSLNSPFIFKTVLLLLTTKVIIFSNPLSWRGETQRRSQGTLAVLYFAAGAATGVAA